MTKAVPQPETTPRKIADNAAAWPWLAYLLAPAAGCDCQMLALSIADGLDKSELGPDRAVRKR